MGIFDVGAAEEGVEEAAFAYVAAAEEGDFGDGGGREVPEVGGAVEEVRWRGVEEKVGVF